MSNAQEIRRRIATTQSRLNAAGSEIRQLDRDRVDVERLAERQAAVRHSMETDIETRRQRMTGPGLDPARVRTFARYETSMSAKLSGANGLLDNMTSASRQISRVLDDLNSRIAAQTRIRQNLEDDL